jgi:polyvinyl alcohol dehydrogenase (cytochrome)
MHRFRALAAILAPLCCAPVLAQGAAPASAPTTQATPPMMAGTEFGFGIFQQHCTSCHGNPAAARAPSPEQLRQFTPERILDALTSGPMKTVGDTLTELQRRQVAESLAGRPLGAAAPSGDAAQLPNRCAENPPLADPAASPGWNGWGAGPANTRFQDATQAGLSAASVPGLKLQWVFGLPNATSAYSQPTVVSGRVFVGSDTGYVYALDARTGCLYWSYQSRAGVRNAVSIGAIRGYPGVRYALYYGDLKANVYALDAQTGALLWTRRVEPHYTDRVTAAPALYQGRLYVPVSSWEEFAASAPNYPCCTSVGNVVALDANTGAQLWKTYVIAQRPRPVRRNKAGIQQWAPAGASVWNTPTIDPKRHAVYFGTGDATTYPAASTSDSVMALDLRSGRVLWSYQVHHHDSFLGGCWGATKSDNCPKRQGPDWDIPSSVMLRSVAGRDLIIVGTKPGDILALDPEHRGQPVWRVNVHGEVAGDGPPGGMPQGMVPPTGVLWGGASDAESAYFGLMGGGVAAIRLTDGQRLWWSALGLPPDAHVMHSAALTVIPGVAFVGGSDGKLSAVSTRDGSVLWQFATMQRFDAVDKVPTRGGSISAPGAVVAGGRVFVGSGYAVLGGTPGNALLAFAID